MENDTLKDPRIEKILHLIMEYAGGNLDAKIDADDKFDEIDGIIGGLNMLGEELKESTVSRDFLKNIINTMSDGIIIISRDLIIQEMNPIMESLLGIQKKFFLGNDLDILFSENQTLKKNLIQDLTDNGSFAAQEYFYNLNNIEKYILVSGFGIMSNAGEIAGYAIIFHDITLQKQREEELRISAITFESNEGIIITDPDAKIVRVNRAFQKITGYSADEVVGQKPSCFSAGHLNSNFYQEMWKQINRTGKWEGEIHNRKKNGQIFIEWLNITSIKDDDNKITHYVGIFSDITRRKEAEEEIKNLAFYDPLTALPNRRFLMERFNLAISRSERTKYFGAVIFIDLDNFKRLNDTKGHEYGDMLLVEVALRITSCLRKVDTVSRFGGDEFVILFEELSKDHIKALKIVNELAEKIRLKLTELYNLNDFSYFCSPSIGISLYKGDKNSVSELLKFADIAMYSAKEAGRNSIRLYDPVMQIEKSRS